MLGLKFHFENASSSVQRPRQGRLILVPQHLDNRRQQQRQQSQDLPHKDERDDGDDVDLELRCHHGHEAGQCHSRPGSERHEVCVEEQQMLVRRERPGEGVEDVTRQEQHREGRVVAQRPSLF